jgi:hypothetical protein
MSAQPKFAAVDQTFEGLSNLSKDVTAFLSARDNKVEIIVFTKNGGTNTIKPSVVGLFPIGIGEGEERRSVSFKSIVVTVCATYSVTE